MNSRIFLAFRHDELSADLLARLIVSLAWGGIVGQA